MKRRKEHEWGVPSDNQTASTPADPVKIFELAHFVVGRKMCQRWKVKQTGLKRDQMRLPVISEFEKIVHLPRRRTRHPRNVIPPFQQKRISENPIPEPFPIGNAR